MLKMQKCAAVSYRGDRKSVIWTMAGYYAGLFADLLTFVLGFILVMGGVQQIASLSAARRWTPVPGGFYVVPVAILLAGLVALFNPTGVRSTAFIIIGITSLVYAVSELINWFKFTRLRPKAPVTGSKSDDDIEDAKIIE